MLNSSASLSVHPFPKRTCDVLWAARFQEALFRFLLSLKQLSIVPVSCVVLFIFSLFYSTLSRV